MFLIPNTIFNSSYDEDEDFDENKLPLMLSMINAIVEDKKLKINWEAFRWGNILYQ